MFKNSRYPSWPYTRHGPTPVMALHPSWPYTRHGPTPVMALHCTFRQDVSESDNKGSNYLSDNDKFVLFERSMFEDYSFKYRKNIHFIYVNITTFIYMPGVS